MVDGREVAPLAASKNMYLDKNGDVIKGASINGPKAAGIPGVPAGLEYLSKRYGRLSLKETLAPAIKYAEEGFPVTERYQKLARYRLKIMQSYPATAAIFLEDNKVPNLDYKIIQKDLAETLRQIAEHGSTYFYTGGLAARMIQNIRSKGGIWSTQDLSAYHVIEREPVVSHYKNLRIISAPPPSSGGIVLAQALTMLEGFDLSNADDIERMHIKIIG